jgi:hypothetical protein
MKNLRIFAALLAIAPIAAGAGLSSCGRTNEAGGEVVPASAIGLDVRNQNFLDVDVFSIVDGLSTRLGTVTGNGSRHFLLDPALGSRDFHLIAVPIGGAGRASSGNVAVAPGQTIVFTVGAILQNSNVTIR